ncbi:MAG: hypothetical protein Q8K86_04820 [Candidatus Nanopelagicaceae bacterium]|nr:hypothetical protein [Candidatus Nanopelagicaceae bacterium]
MRRILASGLALGIMIITLVATGASAAEPLPGSSACNKVKAQVLVYEKQEQIFKKEYEPVNGIWSWFFTSAHLNKYWNLQKEIVDFEVAMFAYDNKNLSCFTPRQRTYAKAEILEWKEIQKFLQETPDWVTGFSFIPIAWDSIFKA